MAACDPRSSASGPFYGETALMEIVSKNPDVAVIELGLPGVKGDEAIGE